MKQRKSTRKNFKRLSAYTLIISSALAILTLSSCKNEYRRDEGMVWHTSYHIIYESGEDLRDSILSILNDVDKSLNVFNSSSLVSKVNENDSIEIDCHFKTVYEASRRINELSGGAFDPTLGPLIDAWGFGKGHAATADTLKIDSLLRITGIAKTEIQNNRLIKSVPGISFNFSAIAKGYGCDMVAEMLERRGVANYLVEIGGEIRCGGKSPSGKDWRISIDRPIRSDSIRHDSQCIIEISGVGLATSGNYRNFSRTGKSGTGHTISPTTGRPVETDLLSASVIAPTTMEADALATSMMAMGSQRAIKMAREMGCPTLLVMQDSSVWEQNMPIAREGVEP